MHRAFSKLKRKETLEKWKQNVKYGGNKFDKMTVINSETYERFKDARENHEQVTTRISQQWAMAVAFPLLNENFSFIASLSWARNFKRKYMIRQRKVTKFISRNDVASLEDTVAAAENFQKQTRVLMPKFLLRFVINTDQSGCQYEIVYNRSLNFKGAKTVLVQKKNLNKMTHSYTVQYSVTAAGTLLPTVFLCMQETGHNFGPRVAKTVEQLTEEYGNVYVTCSKSGKLTKNFFVNTCKTFSNPMLVKMNFCC